MLLLSSHPKSDCQQQLKQPPLPPAALRRVAAVRISPATLPKVFCPRWWQFQQRRQRQHLAQWRPVTIAGPIRTFPFLYKRVPFAVTRSCPLRIAERQCLHHPLYISDRRADSVLRTAAILRTHHRSNCRMACPLRHPLSTTLGAQWDRLPRMSGSRSCFPIQHQDPPNTNHINSNRGNNIPVATANRSVVRPRNLARTGPFGTIRLSHRMAFLRPRISVSLVFLRRRRSHASSTICSCRLTHGKEKPSRRDGNRPVVVISITCGSCRYNNAGYKIRKALPNHWLVEMSFSCCSLSFT